jgi:hypothetical protein
MADGIVHGLGLLESNNQCFSSGKTFPFILPFPVSTTPIIV